MINPVPLDTVKAVIERRNAGMKNPSVETNADGYIIPRRNKYTAVSEVSELDRRIREPATQEPGSYTVIVRPSKRKGPRETSTTAVKLKACKGKKGCDFARCVEDAFGKMPRNFQRLCPTGTDEHSELDSKEE